MDLVQALSHLLVLNLRQCPVRVHQFLCYHLVNQAFNHLSYLQKNLLYQFNHLTIHQRILLYQFNHLTIHQRILQTVTCHPLILLSIQVFQQTQAPSLLSIRLSLKCHLFNPRLNQVSAQYPLFSHLKTPQCLEYHRNNPRLDQVSAQNLLSSLPNIHQSLEVHLYIQVLAHQKYQQGNPRLNHQYRNSHLTNPRLDQASALYPHYNLLRAHRLQ